MRRNQKGITLIALIITIVVLLILAVVTINAIKGDGIIQYAQNARDDYQTALNEEEAMLQNYLNILNEETKTETEAEGAEYEAISVETDCIKYYADVDGNKEPDGIIYIDIANTQSGSWNGNGYTIENKTTGLKEYYISKESHTTTEFGTAPVLSLIPNSTGEERFYVMALEDVNNGTKYCWYDAAQSYSDELGINGISDYATLTSSEIGAGKTNTETMMAKWNSEAYGAKNNNSNYLDMWGIVEEGWYIPSVCEWYAFYTVFNITSNNYGDFGLFHEWSSTICNEYCPFGMNIGEGYAYGGAYFSDSYRVRLGTTY